MQQDGNRLWNLNVGAGSDPWGDIRLDLKGGLKVIREKESIFADAHYLPFRARIVEEVRLCHVLEHFQDPKKAVREALRVGSMIHAKFPHRYDRMPFLLSALTEPNLKGFLAQSRGVLYRTLLLFHLLNHPQAHRWTIQPFGETRIRSFRIPGIFDSGRKARYTRRLTITIRCEYECFYRR